MHAAMQPVQRDRSVAIPVVSVIVVNWNTRTMTLECLRSLYAETSALAFETIVVDNGSSDGSAAAIAAGFPQAALLAQPVNLGFAAANNSAAERAQGRYLLLLNSDTVVLDRAVERLVAFAQARPRARIWGGRTVFADGRLNIGSAWGRFGLWAAVCFALSLRTVFPRLNLFDPEALSGWRRDTERQVDIVSGCFFLIERSLWDELGGFDPAFFMYGEEADLCDRARRRGARPRVTPDATIVHHGGASAATQYDANMSMLKAKVMLARRTMRPSRAWLARHLMVLGVGQRSLVYSVVARFVPRAGAHARRWREIWHRRASWAR
jgi:GT2 family glycosyltransferase